MLCQTMGKFIYKNSLPTYNYYEHENQSWRKVYEVRDSLLPYIKKTNR